MATPEVQNPEDIYKGYFEFRGDPATYDYRAADLTLDGTWNDLDLSSIIPTKANAVVLGTNMQTTSAGDNIRFRRNGQASKYNISQIYIQSAGISMTPDCIVPVDDNGVIEYKADNVTWDILAIIVKGWFLK